MRTVYSCVIDQHPKFLMQAWTWLLSLHRAGVRPGPDLQILVHHPQAMTGENSLEILARLGATLVPITPFGDGAAVFCNKLRQLETAALQGADRIILCDADLLFLQDPAALGVDGAVSAKPVDKPNPPDHMLEALFKSAGLPLPGWTEPDFAHGTRTLRGNCNGGLYLIPGILLKTLADTWPRWSRFCLSHEDILRGRLHHSDQLGFMLALAETGLSYQTLSSAANFPTHFPATDYLDVTPSRITAFHYHSHVSTDGLPAAVGVDWIDSQMMPVVEDIRQMRRESFDNSLFWSYRYAMNPGLGSGLGSRGEMLQRKRGLLAPVLRSYADRSVADVGCGDLEVMHTARLSDYHGVDPSAEALALAREKRPDWRFSQGGSEQLAPLSADLAISLDVAIHQPTEAAYRQLIDGLVATARDAVLVSGYETKDDESGIVYFHEPLSQTLGKNPAVASVTELGGWRDVRLFLASLHRQGGNSHDICPDALRWGMQSCPTPQLLGDLVGLSREALGFFPSTIIRTLEYPWIASRLTDSGGMRLLDVGAGVAALPLWLARQGAHVETVDPHPQRRDPANRQAWNEWGYLNYALLDPRIRSHHMGVEALATQPFDVIYSVSVIEHMPAMIRRMALQRMAELLVPGGRLLLTLDLVPGTDDLWRLSQGKDVDPDAPHGTVADLLAELVALGFTLQETTLRRAIPGSRTDLLMLDAALIP